MDKQRKRGFDLLHLTTIVLVACVLTIVIVIVVVHSPENSTRDPVVEAIATSQGIDSNSITGSKMIEELGSGVQKWEYSTQTVFCVVEVITGSDASIFVDTDTNQCAELHTH